MVTKYNSSDTVLSTWDKGSIHKCQLFLLMFCNRDFSSNMISFDHLRKLWFLTFFNQHPLSFSFSPSDAPPSLKTERHQPSFPLASLTTSNFCGINTCAPFLHALQTFHFLFLENTTYASLTGMFFLPCFYQGFIYSFFWCQLLSKLSLLQCREVYLSGRTHFGRYSPKIYFYTKLVFHINNSLLACLFSLPPQRLTQCLAHR